VYIVRKFISAGPNVRTQDDNWSHFLCLYVDESVQTLLVFIVFQPPFAWIYSRSCSIDTFDRAGVWIAEFEEAPS